MGGKSHRDPCCRPQMKCCRPLPPMTCCHSLGLLWWLHRQSVRPSSRGTAATGLETAADAGSPPQAKPSPDLLLQAWLAAVAATRTWCMELSAACPLCCILTSSMRWAPCPQHSKPVTPAFLGGSVCTTCPDNSHRDSPCCRLPYMIFCRPNLPMTCCQPLPASSLAFITCQPSMAPLINKAYAYGTSWPKTQLTCFVYGQGPRKSECHFQGHLHAPDPGPHVQCLWS